MTRLLASLLAFTALLACAACGRGKLGITIEQDGTVDPNEITRLYLQVAERDTKANPGSVTWVYFEAIIDREHGWDGTLPTSLIYEGWVGDVDKYHPSVAAYAGDQIIARSSGATSSNPWFSNVDKVWVVELESDVPIWPYP
jgi:hypothetical protein